MKISKPLFITLLILFNAVPVFGVFQWGWQSFDLIFLYWLENLIIGAFMIFRIVARRYSHPIEAAFPLLLAPFFTFHYGMFCYVHGQFVISLFGKGLGAGLDGMQIPQIIIPLIETRHLLWPVVALFAFQLLDWIRDSSERGFGSDSIKELTTAPYRRIVILHITIIASGFALGALNEPLAGLLLLIIFKTGMDIYHWDKDEKSASTGKPAVINEKMRKKVDALIDDPRITINGKEIHYQSFEEFRNSKHYRMMQAIIRMLGGGNKLRELEEYVEQRIQQRNQERQPTSIES